MAEPLARWSVYIVRRRSCRDSRRLRIRTTERACGTDLVAWQRNSEISAAAFRKWHSRRYDAAREQLKRYDEDEGNQREGPWYPSAQQVISGAVADVR